MSKNLQSFWPANMARPPTASPPDKPRLPLYERLCRVLFLGSLCLVMFFVIGSPFLYLWYPARAYLVSVRFAIMTHSVESESFFQYPPSRLENVGFLVDPAELRELWRERLNRTGLLPTSSLIQILRLHTLLDRAKAADGLFPSRGGHGLISEPDLESKVRAVMKEDRGFCAGFTRAYLAVASLVGLQAREVMNSVHTVIEFWDPELQKWIFLDPQMSIVARSPSGELLSFLETRMRVLQGEKVAWDFFGQGTDKLRSEDDPLFKSLYSPEGFTSFTLTLGNNVFNLDKNRYPTLVPRTVGQLLEYVGGVRAGYATLDDKHSSINVGHLRLLRTTVMVVAVLLLVALAGYPVILLIRTARGMLGG